MIVIYKITAPSNKIYIGQTRNYERRKKQYKYLKCESQKHLYKSLITHGFYNHEISIIKEFPKEVNQNTLNDEEKYYINHYLKLGFDLLNIKHGGAKSKMSEETKRKISISHKGKKLSLETIEKIKKFTIGRVQSEEEKKKRSSSLKGRKFTQESIEKIKNSNSKKPIILINIKTGEQKRYISQQECARDLKLSRTIITRAVNNRDKNYNPKNQVLIRSTYKVVFE